MTFEKMEGGFSHKQMILGAFQRGKSREEIAKMFGFTLKKIDKVLRPTFAPSDWQKLYGMCNEKGERGPSESGKPNKK